MTFSKRIVEYVIAPDGSEFKSFEHLLPVIDSPTSDMESATKRGVYIFFSPSYVNCNGVESSPASEEVNKNFKEFCEAKGWNNASARDRSGI